ncbi:hypothetical protein Tco_0231949 [Tanacetum coccineum]
MEEEQNQPEVMQELLLKLMKDLQILKGIQQAEKPKAITPDLPIEEPDNSLSMGDEHLNTIPETKKSSVENLVPIPNISITSPKIDFLPEEFIGELDFIDPILPGIDFDEDDFDEDDFDEDDFNEEERENDNDILQIEELNVNLLVDKIEALNLTQSIPFVLEYPSSSPIPVMDSEFLIEEVDTFLVLENSIPSVLNFEIEHDATVINNFDELKEDECFDPGGGEIDVSQNIEDDDSFAFVIRTFLPYLTYPVDSPLLLSTGSEDTIFDPGIST